MDEAPARYSIWWQHDDWCVVAHEPLWPDDPGIPPISVQFDNWKPPKHAQPNPHIKTLDDYDRDVGGHLPTCELELA